MRARFSTTLLPMFLVACLSGCGDEAPAEAPTINKEDINRGGKADESDPPQECTNTCQFASDGECDDGGEGSQFDVCTLGTDCDDCGMRVLPEPPNNTPNNDPNNMPDPVMPTACGSNISNTSGRDLGGGDALIGSLNDPLANLVLKPGTECPGTYAEMMAKLRENDKEGCDGDNPRQGISSMVVSETSQVLDRPDSYRVATTRRCGGRDQHELFFSLFGLRAGGSVPSAVEVIAFDKEAGVFNYYEVSGGQWTFFGNSVDMIKPGATNRCAQCHTGGGLVMKELDTPWLHWEGHHDTPGAADLVDAHDDLGTKSSGSTMENLVKTGNRAWNETKVEVLKADGDIKELLRPLFCTVEVNLDNAADFESTRVSRIPLDFYLDKTFAGFGGVDMDADIYDQALVDAGQVVSGNGSSALQNADGEDILDTIFAFVFPERAFADSDYVDKLVDGGVIDDDFRKDALFVDFTRPIFSEARCGLLAFAPSDLAEINAEAIRAGFIANLEQAQGLDDRQSAFLANLHNTGDSSDHEAAVDQWVDACKARDQAAHMADVMSVVSNLRNQARELHVFEFPATMPIDDLRVAPSTHFDPETCELTTD